MGNDGPGTWESQFTDRERKEIEFCRVYADEFNHGTDGHLVRGIVAKMAKMLDAIEQDVPTAEDLT